MSTIVGEPVADGAGRVSGWVNAYILDGPGGRILVDTGFSRRAAGVVKAFRRAGVPLAEISTVVLTHQHFDHTGGAARIAARSSAAVACHPMDAPVIEGKVRPKMPFLMRLLASPKPVAVRRLLNDGDRVGPFRVVFVPGHTAGEIALYDPDRKWLVSGDSVVEREGRLTLPGTRFASDLAQAVRSLDVLRRLDVELLLPGHGAPLAKDVAGQLDDLIARAPREFLGRPS
jgi:glyoxylase-like metal-dependent hydrolase (beta-lactamase superfamily II)